MEPDHIRTWGQLRRDSTNKTEQNSASYVLGQAFIQRNVSPVSGMFKSSDLLTRIPFFTCRPTTRFDLLLIQHMVGPIQVVGNLGGPICSRHQQAVWNTVQTSPEPVHLDRDMLPICLAYMLPQWSLALVFVSRTRSSHVVTHPRIILAQCCLTVHSLLYESEAKIDWKHPNASRASFARPEGDESAKEKTDDPF